MSSDLLRESETIELKKSLAELKEGLVSIAAILNKHGAGELWFGVAPGGKPVGLEVNDKTLRDVSQAIAAHIEPKIYPQVSAQLQAGKTCIHVRFDGKEAPYFAHGRAYMRVADEDRQLSAREIENLIISKNQQALRWDNQPISQPANFTVGDLDETKIRHFVERAGLPWDTATNALTKLALMQNGKLLNAARLFFAKTPPIQLRCAVFASTTSATIIDRHDFDGDLLELIDEAQKYILKNIHIGMKLEGLYRVDVPEISTAALREAVINAFCHRDWHDPDYIHIAVFKDRVEIRNPGTLLGGLTIDDIRRGNVSRRRNPLIADLLCRIQMVEAWGRGMPLMLENAPTLKLTELGGLFIASFERPSFHWENLEASTAETVDKTVDKLKLTDKEKALCALVQQHANITQKDLAAQLALTERGVRYLTDKLQKQGVLQRVGGKKAGHWEVVDVGATDTPEIGRVGG